MRLDLSRAARFLAGAAVACCLPGLAAASVTVSSQIPFAQGVSVNQKIKDKCELQRRIPEAIAEASNLVALVEGEGTLSLEITDIHAPGGWIFSGPKWLEVRGQLASGESFRAKRFSAVDPFSGGVCGILGKISRALGEDIAAWVASPSDNAELGDAQ